MNLSGRHFMDPNCATVLYQAAVDAGVDPSAVDLELTETSRIELGSDTLSRVASQLRQLGFHLWLDDFGTGWSSLEYLLWLPFDGIKIDRAVTVTLGVPIGDALTTAVTGIANALGMKTTIEGIESPAHADLARALGCDYGQGFIWAHPASAATITHTLTQAEPATTK